MSGKSHFAVFSSSGTSAPRARNRKSLSSSSARVRSGNAFFPSAEEALAATASSRAISGQGYSRAFLLERIWEALNKLCREGVARRELEDLSPNQLHGLSDVIDALSSKAASNYESLLQELGFLQLDETVAGLISRAATESADPLANLSPAEIVFAGRLAATAQSPHHALDLLLSYAKQQPPTPPLCRAVHHLLPADIPNDAQLSSSLTAALKLLDMPLSRMWTAFTLGRIGSAECRIALRARFPPAALADRIGQPLRWPYRKQSQCAPADLPDLDSPWSQLMLLQAMKGRDHKPSACSHSDPVAALLNCWQAIYQCIGLHREAAGDNNAEEEEQELLSQTTGDGDVQSLYYAILRSGMERAKACRALWSLLRHSRGADIALVVRDLHVQGLQAIYDHNLCSLSYEEGRWVGEQFDFLSRSRFPSDLAPSSLVSLIDKAQRCRHVELAKLLSLMLPAVRLLNSLDCVLPPGSARVGVEPADLQNLSKRDLTVQEREYYSLTLVALLGTSSLPPPLFIHRITPWKTLYCLEKPKEGDSLHSSVLGSGGFGDVYAATTLSGQPVAIKYVDTVEAANRRRAWNEISLLGSLRHKGIVKLHGVLASFNGSGVWLVLERIQGKDCHQLARQDKYWSLDSFDADVVRDRLSDLLIQVLSALQCLHNPDRNGGLVLHRDIKPRNIMAEIVADGEGVAVQRFVLVDFNISDRVLEASDHLSCTPQFAAPEVRLGLPHGPPSDVFSLGLTAKALVQREAVVCGSRRIWFADIAQALPAGVECISNMVHDNPDCRPTVTELLESEWLTARLAKESCAGLAQWSHFLVERCQAPLPSEEDEGDSHGGRTQDIYAAEGDARTALPAT